MCSAGHRAGAECRAHAHKLYPSMRMKGVRERRWHVRCVICCRQWLLLQQAHVSFEALSHLNVVHTVCSCMQMRTCNTDARCASCQVHLPTMRPVCERQDCSQQRCYMLHCAVCAGELVPGSSVGTSSGRRRAQLLHAHPHLRVRLAAWPQGVHARRMPSGSLVCRCLLHAHWEAIRAIVA